MRLSFLVRLIFLERLSFLARLSFSKRLVIRGLTTQASLITSIILSGFSHLFPNSTIFHKLYLQLLNQLIQQPIGLMNKGNRYVGNSFCGSFRHRLSIKLAIIMRCACPFGLRQSFIVSLPLFQSSYTKKIFIVYYCCPLKLFIQNKLGLTLLTKYQPF